MQQAQGLAAGREGQGRMQQEADGFVAIVPNRPQPPGWGMGRIVEHRSVLHAEHEGVSGGTFHGGLHVRGEERFGREPIMIEKAIGSFGPGPRAARLRNGCSGLLREVGRHENQSFHQPPIRQRRVGKFMLGPLALACQFYQRLLRLRPCTGRQQDSVIHGFLAGVRNRDAASTTCARTINYRPDAP